MKFKIGDIVIISKITLDDYDDEDEVWFLVRKREKHTIGKIENIDLESDMPIFIKVIHSSRTVEIGEMLEFKESELITINEAIKRGEMYDL